MFKKGDDIEKMWYKKFRKESVMEIHKVTPDAMRAAIEAIKALGDRYKREGPPRGSTRRPRGRKDAENDPRDGTRENDLPS